jgi:hypothetical protein
LSREQFERKPDTSRFEYTAAIFCVLNDGLPSDFIYEDVVILQHASRAFGFADGN